MAVQPIDAGLRLAKGDGSANMFPMLIVHVHIQVRPDAIDTFISATETNARASLEEPGITRFDLLRQDDDPSRFLLVEVYRTDEDAVRHKETAHYATWRDTVAPMMAEPRRGVKYRAVP